VVLQHLRNREAVISVFSGDIGQCGNFNARIDREILQSLPVVFGHIGRVVRHSWAAQLDADLTSGS
jgi:hypothetical protein